MLIGIPKEIKNNENRVGLTPAGVQSLVKKGHHVLVETNAGLGSGFADEDYTKQGATIVATAAEAWAAEMVVKVKEPLAEEYGFLREDLLLFTYLHMAAAPELADAMVAAKTTLPVIGVPVKSRALSGLDSLYSIVQMPGGVPVATMAIGESGAKNAALTALRILAIEDAALAEKLEKFAIEQGKAAEVSTDELD